MHQFITSSDLAGIIPEIILTLTALCVLSLEMMRLSRSSVSLLLSSLGLVAAGIVVMQGNLSNLVLFGGMLKLNQYSLFFDILYLLIGLLTLIFSQGYLVKKGTEFRAESPALILF